MFEPHSPVLTLKRQPAAGAAILVATLEDAWSAIRAQHPDVPAVQILVGQGSRQRGGPLLGYFVADRWQPAAHDGELVHELVIAGEGLARGADDVFTTLLHEAAHALAVTRNVSDTSRDGRYHNHHYRQLADELGLDVQRDPAFGWSTTTLRPTTRAQYADAIDALAAAITLHRLPEPIAASRRGLLLALCGCPRRIRVAPAVLQEGPITCHLCGQPFCPPAPAEDAGAGSERAS